MNQNRTAAGLIFIGVITAGCDNADVSGAVPKAAELNGGEIGYYCNMSVAEHRGPKGQIFLDDREQPLWFTSARDTIAFTMLPEEPKNISAMYVSDMGKASWDNPEPGIWVDARSAWYVVGSGRVGGMGAPEPVPFAEKGKATAFQAEHGGRVLSFADIPEDEILGFDGPAQNHMSPMKVDEPL
jgi:copper chaperone NosL